MAGPEARVHLQGCDVLLLGTVAGFVPDGQRVAAAASAHEAEAIVLGVPPEDVAAVQALVADPGLADDLPELDETDERLLQLLERFGATRAVPSPDLAAAHAAADATGVTLEPVDLDDNTHAELFTDSVKVRHLVQRSRARRRAQKRSFDEASDAWDLARRWDAELRRVRPLGALEVARETAMADGIRRLAARHARLLAVVPVACFDGVLSRLQAPPS